MRPYNSFETKNVKFLVDQQIEFATIQITETGLKKSILDATAPVRAYFEEFGAEIACGLLALSGSTNAVHVYQMLRK